MLKFLSILFFFSFWNSFLVLSYLFILLLVYKKLKSLSAKKHPNTQIISFLHPFCNDCGGGEKVLWMILKAMVDNKSTKSKSSHHNINRIKINILCGVKDEAKTMLKNIKDRFEIDFKNYSSDVLDIELVRLKTAHLLKPKPAFTMLLQILGQIIFAFEIITTVYSNTIIDTTGLPFTYMVLKFFGRANVIAYVHYPFISDTMINDVKTGTAGVHSRGILSKIPFLKNVKILYYKLILFFYKLNGKCVDFAFCNSTWTFRHVKSIWTNTPNKILYPPCSTNLYKTGEDNSNRKNVIVSCAQFRPEKRQKMQVDILKILKEKGFEDLKLCIVGSIRDKSDQKLFDDLQDYINSVGLKDFVELCPNLPLGEVKKKFETSKVGLHTMRDEHFGISVIEMMASGLITIAHKSAGPKDDIIGPSREFVGLLANDEAEYADNIQEILLKYHGISAQMKEEASKWVSQFSNEEFMNRFILISEENNLI